jgi:hypothetical protein
VLASGLFTVMRAWEPRGGLVNQTDTASRVGRASMLEERNSRS